MARIIRRIHWATVAGFPKCGCRAPGLPTTLDVAAVTCRFCRRLVDVERRCYGHPPPQETIMPLGPPSPPNKAPLDTRMGAVTATSAALVKSMRAIDHLPAARIDAANTAAYVMAKHCQRMAARIGRGAIAHASPDALRQLRDYADGLRDELRAAIAATEPARPASADVTP